MPEEKCENESNSYTHYPGDQHKQHQPDVGKRLK